MNPRELSLFVTAAANCLYECLPAEQLPVAAAVFSQLGDTLMTMSAQAEFLGDQASAGGAREC
ncbi:MAG: hypothetical protein HDT14_11500 [Oscillibacter sp.]|nr:hypothetical protein [Oscillibacter sp.]